MLAAVLGVPAILAAAPAMGPEFTSLSTPRGAPVTVIADFPAGAGPFPTVVLGPGTGTTRQPINQAVSDQLKAKGFAVYRFEWAWYVKDAKGKPSDTERAPEIEDFDTVIAAARADRRVDAKRVLVGGKSRGTIIGWRVLRADPTLRGIIQLTPVCVKDGFTPDQLYPGLAAERRPSIWLTGDVDPACDYKTLYRFIGGAGGYARVDILRGDHGLALPETSELAGRLAVDFAMAAVADAKP